MGAVDAAGIETVRRSAERLAAVAKTGLLDTPPTDALDRLTRLAAALIDAPATFISLVDADRDFYVSNTGFGEPLASTRELRGTTFCHHTLVSDDVLAIDDTRADPVYRSVPTVESMGVGAYLGVPLRTADGQVVGSLCAIDFKPRVWSARDKEVLGALAASALREMQLMESIGTHLRRADEARLAQVEAERTVQARRDALNAVAHDLRDPLNTIFLALGMLKAVAGDERAAKPLEIAQRQALRMRAMLDDLLDVARIDGGNLHIQHEVIEMRALLLELAGDRAAQASAAGLALEVDAPDGLPALEADRARLQQVISNLVSNALKFTPAGGRVTLSARSNGGLMRLSVSDTGCGIDPAQLPMIFTPFWQADRNDRQGAGLGLHIVRGIVAAHGGEVRASSEPGRGTTFEIDLPVERAAR